MPSFDIVSKADAQKLDNAINVVRKEIVTRYDFHDSKSEVEFDKKALLIRVVTENDMRMDAIQDMIISRIMKQGLEPGCLDFGKEYEAAGSMLRKEVKIKDGIDKDLARKIVKMVKDSGLKVQASIMEDQVRITSKKRDDLQGVITLVKKAPLEQPLQYINFRD